MRERTVCMIAYANYYTDARIQNYVDALLKDGFQVDVFALGGHGRGVPDGVRVFSLMKKHWGSRAFGYIVSQLWFAWRALYAVSWQFLKRRYCLVHVHNMPNFIVFCGLVPKLAGARIILDVHDTMPESYATKFDLELTHPLVTVLKWEERLSAWFAAQVITTNDLHKQMLCAHGVSAGKIEVILNVGNHRIFKPVPNRPQTDANDLILVYHGTIAERLGPDVILRALALARRECPALQFLLIGDGDFLPAVRTLVREYGLQENVHIIGFSPVEELPSYLSQADIGVVGNRAYTEAKQNYMLPVKMLEYAAMEMPTIAPRLRVIRHYFDEDTALFYTPDDPTDLARQIIEVYQRRGKMDEVKRRLRLFNQRYNWPAMERKYLQIVGRLIGTQSPSLVQS